MRNELRTSANGDERRQSQRLSVLWSGRVSGEESEVDCVLLNVSAHGALLRLNEPIAEDDPITLKVQRFGDIIGEIVWHEKGRAGLRFLMPAKMVSRLFKSALPEFHMA